MTTATMIKIERTPKMEAAISRCRKAHPKVRRIDTTTVAVTGSDSIHTVKILTPRADLVLAACDCQTGKRALPVLCLHIPAALAILNLPAASLTERMIERETAPMVKPQPRGHQIEGWDV